MKLQAERMAHLNAKAMHIRMVSRNDNSNNELPDGVTTLLANKIKELEIDLQTKRALVEEFRQHIGQSPSNLLDTMTASMHRELSAVSSNLVNSQIFSKSLFIDFKFCFF